MYELAILTSNYVYHRTPFRAGGVRFIADLLPYLFREFDAVFYAAGDTNTTIEYKGVPINVVKTTHLPVVEKGLLGDLNIRADVFLFLDYGAALSPNAGRRNVVVFHHLAQSFFDESPRDYLLYFGLPGLAYLGAERAFLSFLSRKVDSAAAVSDVTEPYLEKYGFRVRVVGNGVDPANCKRRKKEAYAVVLGRLVPYKRHDMAIRAALDAGLEVKVIGTGPEEKKLRSIFASEDVEFLGYVEEERKWNVLSRAKYLISLSVFEGFNLPLVEAMMCGTVPLATRNRAHRYVLRNGEGGFLVGGKEEAVRIMRKLEEDPAVYGKWSERARKVAKTYWSAETVSTAYISLLRGLLENI